MNGYSLMLLAQGSGAAPDGSLQNLLLFVAVIGLAFYFIILRPQRNEQKQRDKLLSSLSRGDKVITAGGIHGTVVGNPDKDTVEVEVCKNTRVTFNRSSISVINPGKNTADKEKDAKEEKKK